MHTDSEVKRQAINDDGESIDWNFLWSERFVIAGIVLSFMFGSLFISYLLPEIYRADTLLMPVTEDRNSQLSGQLGLAANFAGLNLDTSSSKSQIALATLQSREFITKFIVDHDLLPWLFASSFDKASMESKLDASLYNSDAGVWLGDGGSGSGVPSDWMAYSLFAGILSISQDSTTRLVNLSIEWEDPYLAALWANQLVSDVNEHLRAKDTLEATKAIQFLEGRLQTTQLLEMQRLINRIIETQTQTLMLADVRDGYAFEVIDPAVPAEQKISPRRLVIMILSTFFGAFFALFFVYSRRMYRHSRGVGG